MADMKELIKEVVLEAAASTDVKVTEAMQLMKQQQRQLDDLANKVEMVREEQHSLVQNDSIEGVQQMILAVQKQQAAALQKSISDVAARLQEAMESSLDRIREFDEIEQRAADDHKKRIKEINALNRSAVSEFVLSGWYNVVLVLTVIIVCFASSYVMGNRTIARINEAAGNLWGITGATWYNNRYGGDLQPEEFAREWDKIQKDKSEHPENWPRLYGKKE